MQSWECCVCGHLSYPSPQRGVGGVWKATRCHVNSATNVTYPSWAQYLQVARDKQEAWHSKKGLPIHPNLSSFPWASLYVRHSAEDMPQNSVDVTTITCLPNVSRSRLGRNCPLKSSKENYRPLSGVDDVHKSCNNNNNNNKLLPHLSSRESTSHVIAFLTETSKVVPSGHQSLQPYLYFITSLV